MKVLAIHNFHRKGSASGDDQVYKSETALLESHGVEVVKYFVYNDEFDNAGIMGKLLCSMGMLWSRKHYKAVKELIAKEQPDVVHIHTFFPLLSPSILYAAKRSGCKVVVTLHDTRFVCPCATSLRGTQICNACGDGNYFRMAKYGCFKNSKLQSLIVAFIFKYHRIRKSFYKQIDKYICLNENQMQLLEDIGFDAGKMVKKYNFVPDAAVELKTDRPAELPERYVVFYGRIGEEKGIRLLMKIWEQLPQIPLVVMGGGPLEEEFGAWAWQRENVFYLGYTQHDACMEIVKGGEFVVFPSIWYEGCSMVEIETESLGKALIATDLGFSAEAINDGVNGYKVPLNDVPGFEKKITELWNNSELCRQMGANARADYVAKYQPEDNYRQLMDIYRTTVSVVVPFYKGNQYLERLLSSINRIARKKKGMVSFEVIIVNDSPGVKVELPVLDDCQIHIQVQENLRNMGIHGARINGLNYAGGEWILFLDQDDELIEDGFERQLQLTATADVVVGNGFYQYGEENRPIFKNLGAMKYLIQKKKFIEIRNLIPSPGECLIRRTAIPEVWTKAPMVRNGADDWFLWLLLFAEGRAFACNEQYVYIHNNVGGQNLSLDLDKMHESSLEMFELLNNNESLTRRELKKLRRAIEFKYLQDAKKLKASDCFRYMKVIADNVIYKTVLAIK